MALFFVACVFYPMGCAAPEEPIGNFRNTHYYVVFEGDYPMDVKDSSILTRGGTLIAKVTAKFLKDLRMEGSAVLLDGRVVNWAGRVNGEARFQITKHAWGRGTGNCPLVPFHTIAADPAQIAAGAVVKIAETVGMKLPDGSIHDGIWRAEDAGSAIRHDRVDLFIGKKGYSAFLNAHRIGHMQPLTITQLAQPLPDSCVFQKPE